MDYMIADRDKKRCDMLREKIERNEGVRCAGSFSEEETLLEKACRVLPEVVLIYVGDSHLNAFSALKRFKEIAPGTKVVFYSEESDYAIDAYDKGADYFLLLPAEDIKIYKMINRYIL